MPQVQKVSIQPSTNGQGTLLAWLGLLVGVMGLLKK
jgi:hypothetical protein